MLWLWRKGWRTFINRYRVFEIKPWDVQLFHIRSCFTQDLLTRMARWMWMPGTQSCKYASCLTGHSLLPSLHAEVCLQRFLLWAVLINRIDLLSNTAYYPSQIFGQIHCTLSFEMRCKVQIPQLAQDSHRSLFHFTSKSLNFRYHNWHNRDLQDSRKEANQIYKWITEMTNCITCLILMHQ